jgi:hypothetical protein
MIRIALFILVLAALPLVFALLCLGAAIECFWPQNDWTYSA